MRRSSNTPPTRIRKHVPNGLIGKHAPANPFASSSSKATAKTDQWRTRTPLPRRDQSVDFWRGPIHIVFGSPGSNPRPHFGQRLSVSPRSRYVQPRQAAGESSGRKGSMVGIVFAEGSSGSHCELQTKENFHRLLAISISAISTHPTLQTHIDLVRYRRCHLGYLPRSTLRPKFQGLIEVKFRCGKEMRLWSAI